MRRLLHTDGTTTELLRPHTIAEIEKLIGASLLDTVSRVHDGQHVLLVDDQGHAKGLPVNPAATTLYHARCRPNSNPPPIVGDAVIVPDEDFA